MKTVRVRNIVIGEGIPKIIVPIVGKAREEIFAAAKSLENLTFDILEWRADWYDDIFDREKTAEILKGLRKLLKDTPILFTFRTSLEGGEKSIEPGEYAEMIKAVSASGYADMVDVEAFTGDEIVKGIIDEAHRNGVRVIASNHDFDKTPDKDEIIARLKKMQETGADIPKIALMPRTRRDVLTLLAATEEFSGTMADRPIITMSMGRTGLISRLCGESFGSAASFGSAGKASAPGQMEAEALNKILTLIHRQCQ